MRHVSPYTSDDQIEAIGRGLIERSLPKVEWTHAAHFAAALWLLSTRSIASVERDLPLLIRAYNAATGVPDTDSGGYHETITQASLRAARHARAAHAGASIAATCDFLMRGRCGDPKWLLEYWTHPLLFSVAARRSWAAPDRATLPF